MNLNLESLNQHKCVWIVGDDINSHVLWAMSEYEYVSSIEELESYNLFGENRNLKAIFSKDFSKQYSQFLKNSNRENWQANLLIKANVEHLSYIKELNDEIILLDALKKADMKILFEFVIQSQEYSFNEIELQFVFEKVNDLKELSVCALLKDLNINIEYWEAFLKGEEVNWYKLMKDKALFTECVVFESKTIPIMQYLQRADYDSKRKGILNFLSISIKDGKQIFEQNELWKVLAKEYTK